MNTATAGDRLLLRFTPVDYPPSAGWSMAARLTPRSASGQAIDLAAGADGTDSFLFDVSATETTGWDAGDYTLSVWVTLGTDVRTVQQNQFKVLPNPRALPAGYDSRSLAVRTLESLQAALAEWSATRGHVRRYKVLEREMEFNSSSEITALIRHWEGEVAKEQDAERRAKGGKRRNRILVRFTPPR